jgi:hypothetical protein
MRTITCLPLLLALCGHAATYHVSPNGNDANNGLSTATALATIQHGADIALAGDSVLVEPGDYQGFAAMDNNGTPNAPIVFIGTGPGVNITSPCAYNDLDGINVENVAWVVIEGFTVNGMPRTGIRSALSDHITLRYNVCADNGVWGILCGFAEHCIIEHNSCSGSIDQHGIYFSNSADDPIIRYNHCFNNHDNGIHMNGDESQGGDGLISNAQVYGNIIHGNGTGGGSGINCDGVVNSVIYDNLLYDNHASGVSLYQIDGGGPSTDDRVYNNTIINASDARWCVNITEGCTGNQVLNNILINQHPFRGSIVIAEDALDGFVSDYNLVVESLSPDGDATVLDLAGWQALGYDAHSQAADPQSVLFMAPQSGDFHPLNAAAQLVDAGTSAVSSVVLVDLDGTVRPQGAAYDIGCFEGAFSTAVQPLTAEGVSMLLQGRTLVLRGGPLGGSIEWLDGGGRRIAPVTRISANAEVPIPSVAWSMAVLRDGSGALIARQRIVLPQ